MIRYSFCLSIVQTNKSLMFWEQCFVVSPLFQKCLKIRLFDVFQTNVFQTNVFQTKQRCFSTVLFVYSFGWFNHVFRYKQNNKPVCILILTFPSSSLNSRNIETQTKRDNYTNVPKPSVFIAGLRGCELPRTNMTKVDLTIDVDQT